MTHQERIEMLEKYAEETISPTMLSTILGGKPYLYNLEAKQGTLTLPHVWRGRNLRIFKAPIIAILKGGSETR